MYYYVLFAKSVIILCPLYTSWLSTQAFYWHNIMLYTHPTFSSQWLTFRLAISNFFSSSDCLLASFKVLSCVEIQESTLHFYYYTAQCILLF